MKRFIIALALVVFMAGAANAEGMMFGIKGGLNLANLTGDIEENSMKMAFGGGIFLNFVVSEGLSIQPELMYMMKGTKWDEDGDPSVNLSYFDINLLGKYAIPMEGSFAPFFAVGPQIAMLMTAEYEDAEGTEDIKDGLKSMDFGIVIGAGFDYMLEGGCISMDVRYVLGLTSIDDEDDSDDSIKNSGIQFLLGYGFAF